MINQLFCYMSDFLPEELQGITQNSIQQDVYDNHENKINYNTPISKGEHKSEKIARKPKVQKDSLIIKRPQKPINLQEQQRSVKARKEYSQDQKKKTVIEVQQRILSGERIIDACQRAGISDRSYQRWKRRIEQGQMQEFVCQSNQIIIEHSYI